MTRADIIRPPMEQVMVLGSIFGTLLVLAAVAGGNADAGDCAKVSASYKAIVAAVADADSAYRACVAANPGPDACTSEYHDLDVATARFKALVDDLLKDCPPRGGR